MPLRLIFMGTPEFAVPTLAAVIAAGHDVCAVYSQPPRPAGRGMAERATPVAAFAQSRGLAVLTPRSLKTAEAQDVFRKQDSDAAVVVAYGLLLPAPILVGPRHGCLNLHPSKLPRWRGAAPIQRTLMAGDRNTAVAIMRMDEGLDTGPVCLEQEIAVGDDLTAGDLHDELAHLGANLMVRALALLEQGELTCRPQPAEGVTYAAKIDKSEGRIDWSQPARSVHNHIRALSPFPGAWLEVDQGDHRERIKVLRSEIGMGGGAPGEVIANDLTVACGEGAVRLLELQRAGKRVMTAAELLRGFPMPIGLRLA